MEADDPMADFQEVRVLHGRARAAGGARPAAAAAAAARTPLRRARGGGCRRCARARGARPHLTSLPTTAPPRSRRRTPTARATATASTWT
jgi:hypothetical protein